MARDKDCLVCPIESPCLMRNCAELLNAEGYRKASEVAKDIFAEIDRNIYVIESIYSEIQCLPRGFIDELKRKYTEDTK